MYLIFVGCEIRQAADNVLLTVAVSHSLSVNAIHIPRYAARATLSFNMRLILGMKTLLFPRTVTVSAEVNSYFWIFV